MTTYPIPFPRTPATERLTFNNRQSISESPFTYARQITNTAARLELSWTWPRMSFASAEIVRAWINSLNGAVGTFSYSPVQFRSTLSTIILASPTYAYNTAIVAGGWAANAATTLRAGQWFQIGPQLVQITSAATNADASGHATINFQAMLRAPFPAGTPLVFANPVGLFSLAETAGIGFTVDVDRVPDFGTINAFEAI